MNDKTIALAQQLIGQLTTSLGGVATTGWHIYVQVCQANCLVNFITGLGWVVGLLLVAFIINTIYQKVSGDWDSDFTGFLNILRYAFCLVAATVFCATMFNGWNWIGIFNPQLYAAHTVVERIINPPDSRN